MQHFLIPAGTLKRAYRKRLSQVLTLSATIVLAAGLAVVWARVVETLREPAPSEPSVIGQPRALVWDSRVFTSPLQLKRYLEGQGLSYARWSARHPTAFGAPAPVRKTTPTKTTTRPKPKPVHHRVALPSLSASKLRPLATTVLTMLLLLGGLAIGGSALIPRRFAPVAMRRLYADPERRMVALAAATAILLGFGVSFYLS
jgi:hypothetical protein